MKQNNEFFIFITTIPSDLDLDLDQDDQGDLDVDQDDQGDLDVQSQGDLDEGLSLPRCL